VNLLLRLLLLSSAAFNTQGQPGDAHEEHEHRVVGIKRSYAANQG
jgi:hypothetical protein